MRLNLQIKFLNNCVIPVSFSFFLNLTQHFVCSKTQSDSGRMLGILHLLPFANEAPVWVMLLNH